MKMEWWWLNPFSVLDWVSWGLDHLNPLFWNWLGEELLVMSDWDWLWLDPLNVLNWNVFDRDDLVGLLRNPLGPLNVIRSRLKPFSVRHWISSRLNKL